MVCAAADQPHDLSCLDLVPDKCISLAGCGGGEANEGFLDDVQKEDHGGYPANPSKNKVTCDDHRSTVT